MAYSQLHDYLEQQFMYADLDEEHKTFGTRAVLLMLSADLSINDPDDSTNEHAALEKRPYRSWKLNKPTQEADGLSANVIAPDMTHLYFVVQRVKRDTSSNKILSRAMVKFFYHPSGSQLPLSNSSGINVTAQKLHPTAGDTICIHRRSSLGLSAGTYRIMFKDDTMLLRVIDENRAEWLRLSEAHSTMNVGPSEVDRNASGMYQHAQIRQTGKRPHYTQSTIGTDDHRDKRIAQGRPTASSPTGFTSGPLMRLKEGQSIVIPHRSKEKVYSIKHKHTLDDNKSFVFLAELTNAANQTRELVIKIPKWRGEDTARDWAAEVRIQKMLDDPIFLKLIGSDSRITSLHMEHFEGLNLAQHCDHRGWCTLDGADARKILADVSRALAWIHKRGIKHNDVKPNNILYNPTKGARLFDWDVADDNGDKVNSGGTTWYIPPEYAYVETRRGRKGDVWALGVVMLYVLNLIPLPSSIHHTKFDFQRIPDQQPDELEKMWNYIRCIQEEAGRLAQSPHELSYLVVSMLEENPDERVDAATITQMLAPRGGQGHELQSANNLLLTQTDSEPLGISFNDPVTEEEWAGLQDMYKEMEEYGLTFGDMAWNGEPPSQDDAA